MVIPCSAELYSSDDEGSFCLCYLIGCEMELQTKKGGNEFPPSKPKRQYLPDYSSNLSFKAFATASDFE